MDRCTGFSLVLDWIDLPVCGPDGWPDRKQGRSALADGLYFVGVPFQRAFASMLMAVSAATPRSWQSRSRVVGTP